MRFLLLLAFTILISNFFILDSELGMVYWNHVEFEINARERESVYMF
jgi:hypothetical protein